MLDLGGRYVAVAGPGEEARPVDIDRAQVIGRLLAERGATILTGGMYGVMEAAARGARDVGGTSIGLLPGTDRFLGSDCHTHLLPTGLGELRNGLLVRCADVVVAVGGSWGTLSEVALARRTGVPVVLVDSWQLPADAGVVVQDARRAVEAVLEIVAGRSPDFGDSGSRRA